MCCKPSAQVIIAVPSKAQLKEIFWKELTMWFELLPYDLRNQFNLSKSGKLKSKCRPCHSFVIAQIASKANELNFHGFHGDNLLIIADDAASIPDNIYGTLA